MTEPDEQAIIDVTQAFATAWSQGDAQGAAACFTEDGVRVGAMGDVQHGRAELEAAYAKMLGGPFAGAAIRQDRGTVRMLSPEFAFWQGGIEIVPPSGNPIRGHVVQLMKKVGERWWILETHPKLFPERARS
jgi:uncharacterized protein (TIGR02246 family)